MNIIFDLYIYILLLCHEFFFPILLHILIKYNLLCWNKMYHSPLRLCISLVKSMCFYKEVIQVDLAPLRRLGAPLSPELKR